MSDVKVWRYSFPSIKGEGWAIFFLDSVGCFAALSDWGDWSYRWNPRGYEEGDGRDFRHFILTCSDDYLLRKLAPQQEYDPEATLQSVKEAIIEWRRDKHSSRKVTRETLPELTPKALARDMWDELRPMYDNLCDPHQFSRWMEHTELQDTTELYCTKFSEQAKIFLQRCMPRLREALKNELGL